MKIGIIGNGVVGHATARCYMEHHEVCVYDMMEERCTHQLGDVFNTDLIFVCIPEKELDEFFTMATSFWANKNYVIKATCPIGTTRSLRHKYGLYNLVHSPEFLTERCAVTDAQLPVRNIIGKPSLHCDCGGVLFQLYKSRFPGIPTFQMSSDESEAIKLFTNAFFATKITFFNEIYELSQKMGLNWENVLPGILSDGRISHSHTQVPGPDGKMGFGGKCLPKDIKMLLDKTVNGLIQAVIDDNRRRRKE